MSIKLCLDDGGLYSDLEKGNNSVRCDAVFLAPICPVEHIRTLSASMCFWTDYRLFGFWHHMIISQKLCCRREGEVQLWVTPNKIQRSTDINHRSRNDKAAGLMLSVKGRLSTVGLTHICSTQQKYTSQMAWFNLLLQYPETLKYWVWQIVEWIGIEIAVKVLPPPGHKQLLQV